MTMYLASARNGCEFEVAEEARQIGATAHCPRKIEWRRVGKKRRPDPHVEPYLPNYLFIDMTPSQFASVLDIKGIHGDFMSVPDRLVTRKGGLLDFFDRVEAQFHKDERIGRNQAMLSQYKAGDHLKMLDGTLEDVLLTFRGMVERAHDLFPKVCVEADMMGQSVTLEIDPLNVGRV